MKLSEAINEFRVNLKGEVAPETQRWYLQRATSILTFLGDVEVTEITVSDLRRWRAELFDRKTRWADHPGRREEEGGLSPWTLHGYVRTCRYFFAWLVGEEILKKDPAIRLKLPKLPKDQPKGN